uniref:Si:ch1073-287p18.1 n=1 Tax=Labrus bergylta TaxID=56723 RepID=A0A3Q3NID4_9LABR
MLFLRTAALCCRAVTALRCLPSGYTASRTTASYIQGQSPEPRIREYFYYIDHQGQLFLDDTKVKNFVTCFKGKNTTHKHTTQHDCGCAIRDRVRVSMKVFQ